MANDLFGGLGNLGGNLGGLMKGLSSFMPQDDPAVKMMNAQTEVSSLEKQEKDLFEEIGRAAVEMYGLESFGEAADRMKLIQANKAAAQAKLDAMKAEQEEKTKAEKAVTAALTCPSCGHINEEGRKFCNECGTKLGAPEKKFCTSCGAQLAAGTRFCGECGARQEE